MVRIIDHLYLFSAIALAVYSQCIIRWKIGLAHNIPEGFFEKMRFIVGFLWEPWVASSIAATFIAGIFWIAALSKFELNYAYPWMAMIFIIMTYVGVVLFGESVNLSKIAGTVLVTVGLILVARS